MKMKRSEMTPEPTEEEIYRFKPIINERWAKPFLREDIQDKNIYNLKEQSTKTEQNNIDKETNINKKN